MPFPLYRELVQTILQYLNISDLHVAAQLSREWQSALRSSKSFRLILNRFRAIPDLAIPPNSAVAAHVAFVTRWDETEWRDDSSHQRLVLSTGHTLPNLERLDCRCLQLNSDDQGNALVVLPQKLKEYATSLDAEFGTLLFPVLASLHSTLTSVVLDMRLTLSEGDRASFESLKALRNLEKLSMKFRIVNNEEAEEEPLHPDLALTSFVALVHSLPVLKYLSIWMWDGKEEPIIQSSIIRRIALQQQQPHQLQLTELDLNNHILIDRPILQALTNIPSLTRINAGIRVPNEHYGLLAKLPNLTSLEMDDPNGLLPDGLFLAARSCPKLRSLTLSSNLMSSEQLGHVLSVLPQLTELSLLSCRSIATLAPLAAHGLPHRLERLLVHNVESPSRIPSSDVQYLLQLKQLSYLELLHCFDVNDKDSVDEGKLRETLGLASNEDEEWL